MSVVPLARTFISDTGGGWDGKEENGALQLAMCLAQFVKIA